MKKYQSINQFSHLIRTVKDKTRYIGRAEDGTPMFDNTKPLPTLHFLAVTKNHGTNAGIRLDVKTNEITFQSRERELSLQSDNAGFAMWASQDTIQQEFRRMFSLIKSKISPVDIATQSIESVVLFGEWAGSNIQQGVAISGLPKMFCLFEVHVCRSDEDRDRYFPFEFDLIDGMCNDKSIYEMAQFGVWEFDIDFEKPEIAQAKLVELCLQIEKECPIGKYFGRKLGIDNTTGEGFVLTHKSAEYGHIQCKIKGSEHSKSKVKTIAPVDLEKYAKVDEFVSSEVTNGRLAQGIKWMEEMQIPMEMKNVGQYIRWINNDISKECSDIIIESQLDMKIIANKASNVAKNFFIKHLESLEINK